MRNPHATKEQGEFHFEDGDITAKIYIHSLRENAGFVKCLDTQPSDRGRAETGRIYRIARIPLYKGVLCNKIIAKVNEIAYSTAQNPLMRGDL
jgi:hypothetical protein